MYSIIKAAPIFGLITASIMFITQPLELALAVFSIACMLGYVALIMPAVWTSSALNRYLVQPSKRMHKEAEEGATKIMAMDASDLPDELRKALDELMEAQADKNKGTKD